MTRCIGGYVHSRESLWLRIATMLLGLALFLILIAMSSNGWAQLNVSPITSNTSYVCNQQLPNIAFFDNGRMGQNLPYGSCSNNLVLAIQALEVIGFIAVLIGFFLILSLVTIEEFPGNFCTVLIICLFSWIAGLCIIAGIVIYEVALGSTPYSSAIAVMAGVCALAAAVICWVELTYHCGCIDCCCWDCCLRCYTRLDQACWGRGCGGRCGGNCCSTTDDGGVRMRGRRSSKTGVITSDKTGVMVDNVGYGGRKSQPLRGGGGGGGELSVAALRRHDLDTDKDFRPSYRISGHTPQGMHDHDTTFRTSAPPPPAITVTRPSVKVAREDVDHHYEGENGGMRGGVRYDPPGLSLRGGEPPVVVVQKPSVSGSSGKGVSVPTISAKGGGAGEPVLLSARGREPSITVNSPVGARPSTPAGSGARRPSTPTITVNAGSSRSDVSLKPSSAKQR